MSRRKKKNDWAGVVIGPMMVVVALLALWKNETRYDYYRAAKRTTEVSTPDSSPEGELISFSGPMDQMQVIAGEYVEQFKGYLVVNRIAEIYAWNYTEDDEGNGDWDLQWMRSIEDNSRNRDLKQLLSSKTFAPDGYQVGELGIDSADIQFVVSGKTLNDRQLKISDRGQSLGIVRGAMELTLAKRDRSGLGNERVKYTGIRIPASATYFGKFQNGQGRVFDQHKKTGLIDGLIQNHGILHHIVEGDRETALNSIKEHLVWLKWSIRIFGTMAVVGGFMFFLGTVLKFLFSIPIIGPLAELGTATFSVAIGLPLALLTIAAGYLVGSPLILLALLLAIGFAVFFIRRKGKATQKAVSNGLIEVYGQEVEELDLKALEFQELVAMATSDSELAEDEIGFLQQWGSQQGWSRKLCEQKIEETRLKNQDCGPAVGDDSHLANLIRLSMADGSTSASEFQLIRKIAKKCGYDRQMINELEKKIVSDAFEKAS